MKIIHTADIHLGSKIESRLKTISKERKADIRATFKRMIDYAKENDIHVILLSGDVFDSNNPYQTDRLFFHGAIESNPDIDFIYLRGNHDSREYNSVEELNNLKMFSNEEWITYRYDDVAISAIEIDKDNFLSLYSGLNLDKEEKNIVLLHGELTNSNNSMQKINLSKLRDKYIDYLALGHIHKFYDGKIDDRGIYVNPGCLEGRSFDECGVKGFVVLDTLDMSYEFVPFCRRVIIDQKFDATDIGDVYTLLAKLNKERKFSRNDIVRVSIVGDVPYTLSDFETDIKNEFINQYFLDVKDLTNKKIDYNDFVNNMSLRGEFVRRILAREDIAQKEKEDVIITGLKILDGRDIE